MLRYYAERFPTVEINNTFYRMPEARRCSSAGPSRCPTRFRFVLKASQRITHSQRLSADDGGRRSATSSTSPRRSGERLGPVLFQLPPFLKKDAAAAAGVPRRCCPPGAAPPSSSATTPGSTTRSTRRFARAGAALCLRRHRGVGRPGAPRRPDRRLGLPAPAPRRLRRRRARRLGRAHPRPALAARPSSSSSTRKASRSPGRRSSGSF